jgi:uncharacterized protein YcbK (DUF882 family)
MLSANFSLREMQCKCGCKAPVGVVKNLQILAQALQQLRDLAGGPLVVTSGYRCPAHNTKVGKYSRWIHVDVRNGKARW